EFFNRLGQRVLATQTGAHSRQSQIEVARSLLGTLELKLAPFEGGSDFPLDLVKALSQERLLVRSGFSQKRLQVAQASLFGAQKLDPNFFEPGCVAGRSDRTHRGRLVLIEF